MSKNNNLTKLMEINIKILGLKNILEKMNNNYKHKLMVN